MLVARITIHPFGVKPTRPRADTPLMTPRPHAGFTLIELVITLAIASILMGVAVPSFVSAVQDAKVREVIDPVRRALLLARSEATRSRSQVTVCPRASDTACGSDWDNGLLVFVDSPASPDESVAVRDADDPIIAVMAPHGTANTLKALASNDRTASGEYTPNFLRYSPNGQADWQNGTLIACDAKRGSAHSLALNVTLTGSVQSARSGTDGSTVLDVFGRAIDCGSGSVG